MTSKAGTGADRDLPVNKETHISNEHVYMNSCRLTFVYSCQWTQVTQDCKLAVETDGKIASYQWNMTRLQAVSGHRWHRIASCQWRHDKIARCQWKRVTRLQAVSGNRWYNIASCQWRHITRLQAVSGHRWHKIATDSRSQRTPTWNSITVQFANSMCKNLGKCWFRKNR